jgi:hypothetical protein
MPNPRDKVKATGDVHLPEVESEDLTTQGAHPEGTGTPGRPPRGGNRGGEIRDREAPAGDSDENTRDSGEETK